MRCGGGTYIRSIIDDVSRSVGTVAHMVELERTQQGVFGLEHCLHQDDWEFDKICPKGRVPRFVSMTEEGARGELANLLTIDSRRTNSTPLLPNAGAHVAFCADVLEKATPPAAADDEEPADGDDGATPLS